MMVQLEQFLAAYDHRANTRLALPDVHTNCGSPTRFPELITYNDPLIACALPAHASHAPSARRGSRLSARGPLALNFARRAGPGAPMQESSSCSPGVSNRNSGSSLETLGKPKTIIFDCAVRVPISKTSITRNRQTSDLSEGPEGGGRGGENRRRNGGGVEQPPVIRNKSGMKVTRHGQT
jgi:hypothetical protein